MDITWLLRELDVIKANDKNNVEYLTLKNYHIFDVYANNNFIYGTKE